MEMLSEPNHSKYTEVSLTKQTLDDYDYWIREYNEKAKPTQRNDLD